MDLITKDYTAPEEYTSACTYVINELTQDREKRDILMQITSKIWYSFLEENSVCTMTQLEKLGTEKENILLFNKFIKRMSDTKWIESSVDANYASIRINKDTAEHYVSYLEDFIESYKADKYKMQKFIATYTNKAKRNNKTYTTSFVRKGFKLSGNYEFQYDTKYILKYADEITRSLIKDLVESKAERILTYEEINKILINYYVVYAGTYTIGENISDARGRAVFECTRKILNPIGCKIARSLLQISPQALTEESKNDVFMAITELLGYKPETREERIAFGKQAYAKRMLPDKTLNSLHKIIYLERIYDGLDTDCDRWDIPIAVDACSSMMQIIGCLLGNVRYLEETNVIGERFSDMWSVKGLSREHVKKAMTPILYGSSATVNKLWKKNGLRHTTKQIAIMQNELDKGKFKDAKEFKEFILKNCEPKETHMVTIGEESVEVACNKFKRNVKALSIPVYSTSQRVVKRVNRLVQGTPDLEQFRRYYVTLLIHNLDSQICNKICENEKGAVIPIHDAFTVHPNRVKAVKKLYSEMLYGVYKNGEQILRKYFRSVGIPEQKADEYLANNLTDRKLTFENFSTNSLT